MELEQYLKKTLAPSTVKRYLKQIELFEKSIPDGPGASYGQIMEYLGKLRKRNISLSPALAAIKKYYHYQVKSGSRKDNPAKSIRLRDNNRGEVQLQDLFSKQELEKLLERKERYPALKNRNRIIISLLIYQALRNAEIIAIELKDLNLEKGIIEVRSTIKPRTLKLESNQVYWLMNYIQHDRPALLKMKTEKLLITKSGRVEMGEGISYVLKSMKGLYPKRILNPKTVRQSVLANLLASGKDLRLVQEFAGHKYPSTTERYRQTRVEELKVEVLKYHPLQ